jgi:hypothetical protein
MKNAVFGYVTPCDSSKNQRFGGMLRLHHQGEGIDELGTMLAVTKNQSTLRRNSHPDVGGNTVFRNVSLTTATRRKITENDTLQIKIIVKEN